MILNNATQPFVWNRWIRSEVSLGFLDWSGESMTSHFLAFRISRVLLSRVSWNNPSSSISHLSPFSLISLSPLCLPTFSFCLNLFLWVILSSRAKRKALRMPQRRKFPYLPRFFFLNYFLFHPYALDVDAPDLISPNCQDVISIIYSITRAWAQALAHILNLGLWAQA